MSAILFFQDLGLEHLPQVGGKNASLGEMIGNLSRAGVNVPQGFAVTAEAYRSFMQHNRLDALVADALQDLDTHNVQALARAGSRIRSAMHAASFVPGFTDQVRVAYDRLAAGAAQHAVAVRSSATAEDLPEASFAGQQETLLNVSGLDNLLEAIKRIFASLYTDRAISYRVHHGFPHEEVALSVGVQSMVHSSSGVSGVMFSLDTESGFDQVVFVTASYGLGECVVQGSVNTDEFYLYKPNIDNGKLAVLRRVLGSKEQKMVYAEAGAAGTRIVPTSSEERGRFCLGDGDLRELGRQALAIERHYGRPMDIEWAKDGLSGELYILQARPETVASRQRGAGVERYVLQASSAQQQTLVSGRSVGQKIGSGAVRIIRDLNEMARVEPGDVLTVSMTDPDWEPVMKKASAIVTDKGGRTCHAAIIARELGIPAVVGCGDATKLLRDGQEVTVSCAQGDTGYVYSGILPFDVLSSNIDAMPTPPCKLMMNVGNPERAFSFSRLPNAGVGLARLEFIINRAIGVHPQALLDFDNLDAELQERVNERCLHASDKREFFVRSLAEGVATIAAAFAPKPVIVRFSDFKSNEYRNLLAGSVFEPEEENPMIGYRGAARYLEPGFAPCFALECAAIKRVREDYGLENLWLMVPFVRNLLQAQQVLAALAGNGLRRGERGLKIVMMCELPSNALLADEYLEHFDGFSIGSNDMTQLTLGVDRDSGLIADLFSERDPAVLKLLEMAISACKRQGKYIGICGQGPSDFPDFAQWLVRQGIESISLNPDTVVDSWLYLAANNDNN